MSPCYLDPEHHSSILKSTNITSYLRSLPFDVDRHALAVVERGVFSGEVSVLKQDSLQQTLVPQLIKTLPIRLCVHWLFGVGAPARQTGLERHLPLPERARETYETENVRRCLMEWFSCRVFGLTEWFSGCVRWVGLTGTHTLRAETGLSSCEPRPPAHRLLSLPLFGLGRREWNVRINS